MFVYQTVFESFVFLFQYPMTINLNPPKYITFKRKTANSTFKTFVRLLIC